MQDTDDLPQYTNVTMPFRAFPPDSPAADPTGVYERELVVPPPRGGRRVVRPLGAGGRRRQLA
ncbi:hypothetical protein ACFV23_19755, partial [Streptomyces sp. NPDC059627]